MATSQDAVRRLSIQATTSGVSDATAQLKGLAEAQDGVAVASTNTERATLSLDQKFAAIERRYVAQVKAQQDLERVQRQVNAAVSLNPALQDRANAVLAAAEARYNALTKAANDNAAALERQAAEAARAAAVQGNVNAATGVSGGSNSAGRASDVAAYGKSLDDLRAKYNPLFAAGQAYKASLAEINQALKVGAISEAERAAAVMDTKVAFVAQVNTLTGANALYDLNTRSAKGSAEAHAGMSTHAMAAQHSLRSLVEQLASGVPVTQALTGQVNHLTFAASGEGGLSGAFKGALAPLRSMLTVGAATFAGIAAAIGTAALALHSYLDAQQNVQASLLGAGRGSGATSGSINAAADQGSSAFGLSVSEARDLASALAATGKVANDNILPIVKMGHDIAIAFGTDAKGATELLANAFADPVKGADDLNQRLGFLDAATRQNITNLTAQNRQYQAQQVLLSGVKSSLAEFASVESATAKGWAAIGNAASNAWDAVGKLFANSLGLGKSLEDRLADAKRELAVLQSTGSSLNFFTGTGISGGDAAAAIKQKQVDDLTAAIERNAQASARAQAAQQSFLQASTVRSLTPEIAAQEALNNQLQVLKQLMDSLGNDEAAGERLKQLGLSFEQIANALKVMTAQIRDFKSEFDKATTSNKIAGDAITAFSPSARADIARRQSELSTSNSNYTDDQRKTLAAQAYSNALKEANTALSEQARSRKLAAEQSVQSAQLEIDLIGKSVGQQAELRANLQARQALEQQAAQTRTAFDDAEYARLQKINAELGKRTQAAAQAAVHDNISFGRQTALLSPEDVSIAQQLKGIYPDVATALNSVEAAGLRTNAALSGLSSTVSGQLVTGITDIVDGTKSVGQGFQDMSKLVIRAIEEMIIKIAIIQPMMQALQLGANSLGLGSGIASLIGGGGTSAAAASVSTALPTTGLDLLAAIHHTGGVVGAAGMPSRYVHSAYFDDAKRMHTGGIVGDEVPIIAKKGEVVGWPDQLAAAYGGGARGGGASAPQVTVNVVNAPAGVKSQTSQTDANGNTRIDVVLNKAVDEAVGKSLSTGTGRRVLGNQYGIKQFTGQ